MSKHDSWIRINDPVFQQVIHLFENKGLVPVRDPFPMGILNNKPCLWIVDNNRLNDYHYDALVFAISQKLNQTEEETLKAIKKAGYIGVHMDSFESIFIGPEGFCRIVEFLLFDDQHTPWLEDASQKLADFFISQHERWIDGNQQPDYQAAWRTLPDELKTQDIKAYYADLIVNQQLITGKYSDFDVLMGKSFVDILNEIDPENQYSLVCDDDNDDDDI
ncbi:MAG: hypothetical protein KA714_10635 [Limnoraphis sp. WC205]|nr:hypothetical protein [Limnoraphis sp. WC205]